MRYAICGILLALVILGAYYAGYAIGSRDTKLEAIVEENKNVKATDKKKSDIHSKPNISRDSALQLFNNRTL